jgi:two-component system chemotaxis sensor kinase CheA
MSAQDDEFLKMLRSTFKVEAEEHLEAMATGLLELEKTPAPEEQRRLVEKVFRAAHSLKGAARSVNFNDIESICQSLENTFAGWKRTKMTPSPQALDGVHRALDEVTGIITGAPRSPASSVSPERPPVEFPAPVAPVAPEKFSASADTVRITVAKLDARLLEAEEMLTAKLATGQRAADLRALMGRLETWTKEWTAIQPDARALRQSVERSSRGAAPPPGLRRVLEFIEWNHDYLRSLESQVAALSRTAEQDRLTVGKLVDDLLEDSKKMLMLPLATQAGFFQKLVRDLCRDQGKEADLVLRGEEVEIDKRILEEMKDPLIHILRNSIDHGIETPAERQQLGKPPRATITLTMSAVNGSKVELFVSDDGAGIDAERVRESALKHGFISPEEASALGESETHALIFRSDLSTSPIITQISGRGLGLAIVREKAEKLGGHVFVESRRHEGTTIRMRLPVTLATFRGILVETADRLFVVPTASVERVARFAAADVQTVEGRETLSLSGRAVALVRLAEVLELPRSERSREEPASRPVFVLGAGEQRIAFAVDAVLDEQEVLVKQLGKPLSRVRNISGATVLGSGRIAPILHVADLLKSARKAGGAQRSAAKAKPAETTKSILIAEDSITSRMLLKGILEAAGYRVKTAADGIEAFTTLRAERFDLLVSDVEMPRLNGFDLTARVRADKKLADLPVVLVTALETREDRERGIDAGASAYLVKSSFDQSNLLETVRRLA